MSDLSNSIAKQTMEQPKDDVTEASGKTFPSLSDMPIDIVALITEKLDYKQQLVLRKVSKSLRALVDRQKPGCKTIQIVFYKEHLNITFNNQCVMYRNLDYKCKNNTGIVVKRDDFMKVAFDDLALTLKNPKLQLEEFVVYNESSDKYCNEIRNTLESLNHQVSVKKVTFTKSNSSFILAVLPYMKPGVLENISLILYKNRNNQNDEMEKIVLLEQWKQAKELELQNSFDKFPMSSPSLSDMPIDVVGLIIDRSEYKQQLKLRKVSKSLRALVDKQKPACKSILVDCCANKVYITFNGHFVTYSKNLNSVRRHDNAETTINIVRDDFKKVAFADLASTLKNPKLQLDEFIVFDFTREKNAIRNVLESLNHQVSAKKIDIMILSHSCLFSVLPFLKPGTLKKISISFDLRGPDWRILARMEQVALLEQWKQAEELELKNSNGFQMEHATNFKRFHFFESAIDGDKLIRIRDFLSELDNFEHFFFSSFLPYDAVELLAIAGRPAASK